VNCVAGGDLLRLSPPGFNITKYQIPKGCAVAHRSLKVGGRYDGKSSGNLDGRPTVGAALSEATLQASRAFTPNDPCLNDFAVAPSDKQRNHSTDREIDPINQVASLVAENALRQ